jgi:hypothetical protein
MKLPFVALTLVCLVLALTSVPLAASQNSAGMAVGSQVETANLVDDGSVAYLPLISGGDLFEPNDTIEQAWGPLLEDSVYLGYFATAGDKDDYYFFDLQEAAQVTVSVTNIPPGSDYALYLYGDDAAHTQLAYSGEAGSGSQEITTSSLAPGRYYPRVERASGSAGTQPYMLTVTSSALLLSDDFEDGTSGWTPFTNYWRLHPEQWFWDRGQGYGGSSAYTHVWSNGDPDPDRGAHDALTMYRGQGSAEWTDYAYQVRFNILGGRQAGIWFRGQYQDVDVKGQWLTGYYFTVQIREDQTDTAKLWQLRTAEEPGEEPWPPFWYHFSNPLLLEFKHLEKAGVEYNEWHVLRVEVRGNNIKCYVDDELAIDYTDREGSVFLKGTVGIYAYGSPPRYAVIKYDDVLVEPLGPVGQ